MVEMFFSSPQIFTAANNDNNISSSSGGVGGVINNLRQLHELGVVTRRAVTSLLLPRYSAANHSASSSVSLSPSADGGDATMMLFRPTFAKLPPIGQTKL